MVCGNVAECVAETFVVLRDGHDRDDVAAIHAHGLRVGTPDCTLDVGAVEHADLVLVNQCIGGGCCNCG